MNDNATPGFRCRDQRDRFNDCPRPPCAGSSPPACLLAGGAILSERLLTAKTPRFLALSRPGGTRSRRRRWIGREASCAWRAFTDPDGDDHDHEPDHRYTFSNRASTRAQPEMNGRVPSLGRRRQQRAGEGNRASAPALLKERPSCGDQHTEDADVERQMHRAKVEDDLGERGWLHAGAQEPVPHAVEGES